MVVAAEWPGATIDETLQQVTERLERTLAGDPAPRLPAQLHATRRHDDLRQSRRRDHGQGGRGYLVSGAQERRRHPPHAAARRRRAVLRRRLRRRVRDHLRPHRRRLQPARAARLRREHPLEAAAGAGRREDRAARHPGRDHLHRVLHPAARGPRPGPDGLRGRAPGAEPGPAVRDHPDRRRDARAARHGHLRLGRGHPERQLRRRTGGRSVSATSPRSTAATRTRRSPSSA